MSGFTSIIFLLLMLLSVGCVEIYDNETEKMNKNTINLSDLEPRFNMKFPDNSEVLGYRFSPGRDDLAYLKVSIPKQYLKDFLQNSPLQGEDDLDNAKRFFLGKDDDW